MEAFLDQLGGEQGVIACFSLGNDSSFAFKSPEDEVSPVAARRSAIVFRETINILPFADAEWFRVECSERDLLVRVMDQSLLFLVVEPGTACSQFEAFLAQAPPQPAGRAPGRARALSEPRAAAGLRDEAEEHIAAAAAAAGRTAAATPAERLVVEALVLPADLLPELTKIVGDATGGFGARLVENAIEESGLDPERLSESDVLEFCDSVERATRLLAGSARARELKENLMTAVGKARARCSD